MAENDVQGEWTLPDGWVWTIIGEACEVNPRMTRPEQFDDNTLVSFVPMAAVDDVSGAIVSPETRPIGEVWRGYTRFAEGDVIFAKITPCMENGKAAIAKGLLNGIGLGSTEFHVLRPLDGILPQWIYHFVRQESFRGDAAAEMTGTAGQLRVPTKFMQEAMIPLAPLREQRRIVAEIETQFTRLDAAVAALKRAQANIRRYKAAVLQAACEGRLIPTEAELAGVGAHRDAPLPYEPADQLLARILAERRAKWEADYLEKQRAKGKEPKDDKWKQKYKEPASTNTESLPDLPEGWAWTTVEQINLVTRPCAYGVLQPGPHMENGVSLVRVGDIQDGKIRIEGMKRINPEIAAKYPRTKLRGGEVLITLVGAIGRTAVVPPSLVGANTARAVGVITPSEELEASWVEIWFRNPEKVNEMTRKAHEVARKTLNLEDVRAATVALPPLAEQRRIVAEVDRRLSVVEALEASVEAALVRAGRLRQAVLKQAFEGRLVPQDPNDEPASVLLERIKAKRAQQGRRSDRKAQPKQMELF